MEKDLSNDELGKRVYNLVLTEKKKKGKRK